MRKNALALSIAAMIGGLGFVGAATADVIVGTLVPNTTNLGATDAITLQVNNGGLGHALITPYFNAQNQNGTIISITNSDVTNGKAVKVRFRGASNSDDILDFTVLMSPGDVWNATITAGVGGVAQIVTQDRTCTVPQLQQGVPQAFVTNRLTSKGANDIPNNTREGYIEMFNMADIQPGSALFGTIKHAAGVPACTASIINAADVTTNFTTEALAAAQGFATPTTGLFGSWVIVNVPQTTTYGGEMAAIRALNGAGLDGRGNFVLFPQSASTYTGTISNVTADPLYRSVAFANKNNANGTSGGTSAAAISANFFDLPDMSTPYVTPATSDNAPLNQANVLTAALAVKTIANDYANDPIITAKTDWVFSMPTRRYSVAMDYAPATSRRLYSSVPSGGGVNGAGAASQYFSDDNTTLNQTNSQQICVGATSQTFYDREEGLKTSGAVFSPGNATVTSFCGETSVLSFNSAADASVLGGNITRGDTGQSAFTNGWALVNVLNGTTQLGLPILGYAFIKGTNPNATVGVSGTYGITTNHRFTR